MARSWHSLVLLLVSQALLLQLLVCLIAVPQCSSAQLSDWHTGRATYYGDQPWLWTIHHGSCGYGYIWGDYSTGWDVTALSDRHPFYQNSCGTCFEIKCKPMVVRDGYGQTMDRSSVCYDPGASVIVRATDTCPCSYPNNAYSNKRWCCGDVDHFDLSVWAYEKLADRKWGVIGLQWRRVPCDFTPAKTAPTPAKPWPGQPPPSGTLRPAALPATLPIASPQPQGFSAASQPAGSIAADRGFASSLPSLSSLLDTLTSSSSPGMSAATQSPGSKSVVANQSIAATSDVPHASTTAALGSSGLQAGWRDSSWFAESYSSSAQQGRDKGSAFCAKLSLNGALAIRNSAPGAFVNHQNLVIWIKVAANWQPDVDLNISGQKGSCRPLSLRSLQAAQTAQNYAKYVVSLNAFSFSQSVLTDGQAAGVFNGCGANGAWDATTVELRNPRNPEQWVCTDSVELA